MADADGKLKDLSISETKKKKKDGTPKMAPKEKKPQQQKKKVRVNTTEREWGNEKY
jgi:prolyl-tRNA synthetase